MSALDALLRAAAERGGSELHLSPGAAPRLRVAGDLEVLGGHDPLDGGALAALLRPLAGASRWESLERDGDVELVIQVPGVGRHRVSLFLQEDGVGAVLRRLPDTAPEAAALGLSPAVTGLAALSRGLVLVSGPPGSGRSATLAALVAEIDRTSERHVVFLARPLEHEIPESRCSISHREVGEHTADFASGVRAAVRQDAEVVVVDELGDRAVLEEALTAAERGLLVLGARPGVGAARTLDRLLDTFSEGEQPALRERLAGALAAVVSQLLVPGADGRGPVAVREVLLRTPDLAAAIREGSTALVDALIQAGRGQGMQSLDDALLAAVQQGAVDPRDAFLRARDRSRLETLLAAHARS